jgi:Cys-rich repeat protein
MVCDWRSTCVPPESGPTCQKDGDCPAGSFCDLATNKCAQSGSCGRSGACDPGWTCDTRQTCVPADCQTSANCPTGAYCDPNHHKCVGTHQCNSDVDCANYVDMYCDVGRHTCTPRVPVCGGDTNCTGPCPTGYVCCGGTCQKPRTSQPELTCTADGQCAGGKCIIDPFNEGLCHAKCTTDADCGTGDSCQNGYCSINPSPTVQCHMNADCGANKTCINAVCHANCAIDADCSNKADFCDQGICQPDWRRKGECTLDKDCPNPGQECVNAVCRYRCMQDADCAACPAGPTCMNGYCTK